MWAVGMLFLSVHSPSSDQSVSLAVAISHYTHYQRNAARLQQLFHAFREKDCIDQRPERNALPGRRT
jgi:hypothetical protein